MARARTVLGASPCPRILTACPPSRLSRSGADLQQDDQLSIKRGWNAVLHRAAPLNGMEKIGTGLVFVFIVSAVIIAVVPSAKRAQERYDGVLGTWIGNKLSGLLADIWEAAKPVPAPAGSGNETAPEWIHSIVIVGVALLACFVCWLFMEVRSGCHLPSIFIGVAFFNPTTLNLWMRSHLVVLK